MRDTLGRFIKGHPQSNTGRTHLKKGMIPWNKGKHLSEEHKEKDRLTHFKNRNTIHKGYKLLYIGPHKYKAEHRLIIEKEIGRKLYTWEIVHHINTIRTDNRLKNLMLFKNRSEHFKYHKTRR